jgi:hypothetical protein
VPQMLNIAADMAAAVIIITEAAAADGLLLC